MSRDDLAYLIILVGSLLIAPLIGALPVSARGGAAALAGVAAVIGACGTQAAHSLGCIACTVAVLRLAPQRWHGTLCCAFNFGYLGALRLFAEPLGPTNAVQLLMTLRLSSLGFESTDGSLPAESGAARLVMFACCYHGLFTGPYYTYFEWDAAVASTRPMSHALPQLGRSLLATCGAVAVWQGTARLLPFAHVASAEWAAAPFWRRFGYFHASSYQFRFRFYSCWLLMEAGGSLLGFAGASNVSVAACELCTSPSALIAAWNTSVQAYLKAYVYRRLPFRSRPARQLATFAVSAFWHGVRPGYYLCFAFVFAMVAVEQLARSSLRAAATELRLFGQARPLRSAAVSLALHLWTMACFSFAGAAFNLLAWRDTVALWAALRWYGGWLLAVAALGSIAAGGLVGDGRRARDGDKSL